MAKAAKKVTKVRVRYTNRRTRQWLRDRHACRSGLADVGGQTLAQAFNTTKRVSHLYWLLKQLDFIRTDSIGNRVVSRGTNVVVPSYLSVNGLRAWALSNGAVLPIGL